VESVKATLTRLGAGVALGAVVGLSVALALSLGLSIHHTPGLLGNLVAAGTASTCFLLAARSHTTLEAISRAIFGVVAGGAIHAVGARFVGAVTPRAFMGIEAGLPIAEIPLFYAPAVGILASTLVSALPPRKAP
jgi:NhaP-type Na+/H+ or K+/H+ antiporter